MPIGHILGAFRSSLPGKASAHCNPVLESMGLWNIGHAVFSRHYSEAHDRERQLLHE